MENIGPFGQEIGLPMNLNLNNGQKKKKVHMLNVVAKMADILPKIGQLPLWHKDFKWE